MRKMYKVLLLLAVLLAPWTTRAQDLVDYTFSTGTDATMWVDMSSATQILSPSASDGLASSIQSIGFNFPFANDSYTQFSVNTDGNLRLGSTVTSTGSYTTPFSSSYANQNNPKINAFGCDGYGVSGSHYVKSLLVGDSLRVVEFCMGTYTSSTRNELYKWQIHLHSNGNVDIVFPSSADLPTTNPATSHQCGLCVNATDGWVITASSNTATHFTNGSSTTNSSGTWFDANRYYTFTRPIITCPKPMGLASMPDTAELNLSWTAGGTESEWMIVVDDEDVYYATTNSYTITNLSANTLYEVKVYAICGAGDTSLPLTREFRTSCVLTPLPYTENFDSYTGTTGSAASSHILPDCWDWNNDGTSSYLGYPLIYSSTSYANSGSNSLRFYTYYSGTTYGNEMAVLPVMSNADLANAQISMYMRTSSSSYTSSSLLQVGLVNANGDDTSFVVLGTITGLSLTNEEFTVSLEDAVDYPWLNRIALRAPRPTSSYNSITVDDILVEPLPTCFRPTEVTATMVLRDSIVLSWLEDSRSIGADYVIEYDSTGFAIGTGNLLTVSGATTAVLENLTPDTYYDIYVSAVCTSTDISSPRMITVHTACSEIPASALPYTYGFEDATAASSSGTINPCWSKGTNYTTAYPYPSSTHHDAGSRSLYFYSYSGSGYYSYAVMPLFETPLDSLMVTFWMRQGSTGSSYEGTLHVGIMSDPTNINTFTELDVVEADGQTWTYQEVILAGYTGTGRYIAFLDECVSTSYSYVYLDDVTVKYAPNCGHVENLEATHVTTANALIEWEASPLGVYNGGTLAYKTSTETTWTEVALTQDDFSYLLTQLTPGADYTVRIQTNCESGDTSDYATCEFSTNPLLCEGLVVLGGETPTQTSYNTPINNFYNYTVNENLILSSEINSSADTIHSIQFYYAYATAMSSKTNCIMYMGETTASSLGTFIDTSSLQRVYAGSMNCTQGWNTFTLQNPYYYNGGNLVVLILDNSGDYDGSAYVWGVHSSTGTTYNRYSDGNGYPNMSSMNTFSSALRPNMKFQIGACENVQTCIAPDIWISQRLADTIGISWIPGYGESYWNVRYRQANATDWTNLGSVSETSYIFSGLTPATTYDFAIVALCDNGDSAVAELTVTTPCVAIPTPLAEGFANWTASSASGTPTPACWVRKTTYSTTATYPYVSTSYSSDGDGKSMYMYNGNGSSSQTWFALPMLSDSIQNLMMTFDMYTSYATSGNSYAVHVGVMTDPEDFSTFTEVGSYLPTANSQWQEMEVDFSSYTGAPGQVAVAAYGSYCYAYIDNLYISVAPTCRKPNDLLAAADQTGDSIIVTWTGPTNAQNWEVEYGPAGFVPGTGTSYNVADNRFAFADFCLGTDYEVYVRAWCDEEDSSLYRRLAFTTPCGIIARDCMPYFQNFDNAASGSANPLPGCWTKLSSYNTNYPYVSNSSSYAHSGTQSLYFYTDGSSYTAAVLPEFEVGVDSLAINFWVYRTSTTSTYGEIKVGVVTNPNNYSTFVPIATVQPSGTGIEEFEVMLNNYVDTSNSTHHYIVLSTQNSGTNYAYVDDIEVYVLSDCRRPANAYTTNVGFDQLDVVYAPDTACSATDYEIRWGISPVVTAATDSLVTSNTTNTITGLDPETTYYFWIRALCGDGEVSRWLALPAVATTAACGVVEDLDIQYNPASGDIVVSWQPTEIGTPTQYFVSYQSAGNAAVYDTVTDLYYVISNTTPLTNYSISVTTDCGASVSSPLTTVYTTGSCNIIGGGGEPVDYLPTQYYYEYSYTQSIYTANELMMLGDTITGLSWYSLGTPGTTRSLTVYLANTDQSAFSSTSNYIAADTLHRVFTGTMTIANGLNHITFDSVFVRDNTRNLVIAVDDNTGDYVSSYSWDNTAVDATRSIYFYQDGTDIMPASPSASTSGALNYVPKVQFDATCLPPSCVAPIVVCTGQTTNSISLTWFTGLNETSWNVDYRRQGESTWTSAATATTQTSLTINNLLPSSPYEVRVTSLCGTNTANTVLTCFTECGLAPLPFTENFNSYMNTDFTARCWYVGGTTAPYVSNVITYGPMLRLYTNSYVILPEMSAPVNTLQAHFNYVAGDTTAWMLVGVVTDVNAIGSMVIFDTLYSTGIGDRTYTISFAGYTGTTGNIAFYTPHGINYTFIDDLVIEPIRNCSEVTNVSVSNIDSSSAVVSWTPDGTTATSYIVEYGPSGFALGTGTLATTTSTSYTLTGLTPSTSYQVYVYTVCAASSDTSYASMYAMFQTECGPIYSFPYLMDFDYAGLPSTTYVYEMPSCWAYEMATTGTYAGDSYRPAIYYTTSTSYVTSGTHCLRMYGSAVIALPEVAVPLDTLVLTFHEYNSSPNYYGLIIGVVDSITPGFAASFTPIDTIEYTSGVYSYNHEFFLPYNGNARHLAFLNYYNSTSSTIGYSYHYIDDIQLDFVPPCVDPQNVHAAATESSLSVDWSDITAASQWEIEYGPHGFTPGNGTTMFATSHPVNITGLTYSTEYDIRVRAFCSNGDTSSWESISARTTGIMHNLPIELTFEDSTLYNTIDLLNGTMANVWTIGTAYNCDSANAPGHSLYISNNGGTSASYGTSSTLVFATIDVNLDSGWTYYNYDWKCYGESSFDFMRVALIPGGEELVPSSSYSTVTYGSLPAGWVALDGGDRLNQSYNSWNHVNDSIHLGMGGGYHFAFIWRNDGSVTNIPAGIIDNINIWNNASSCRMPIVSTETHDYTQSTINWVGTATDYEVAIKATTDGVWPAEIPVSAYTYTFTGLQPNTEYQIRIRAICDATEGLMSDWTLYTFTTDDLPCFAPTGLACSATELTTATLSWTPGTTETEWNVHVWNSGSGFDSVYVTSANPFTVTGLSQTTTYNVAVSALCGGGLLESEYSDTTTFTTATCQTPGNPTASNVTTNSAVITWTGTAANYVIEYGLGAFGEGQGTTVEVSGTTYTITGLEPETQYSALVRAKCDAVNLSGWTERAVFTTDVEGIAAVGGLNVSIFPNPTSASTTITLSGVNGEVSVAIVDLNGRTLRSENLICEGDCAHQLEVSGLAAGAYFVRISADGVNSVKKLIIK